MPCGNQIPKDQFADYILRKEGFRLDIDNRTYQGLLIINGGGSVALLAFLQAIMAKDVIPEAQALAVPVVVALSFLVAGLPFAVAYQFLRGRTSLAMQGGESSYRPLRRCMFGSFSLSCGCFIAGMAHLLWEAFTQLP